MTFKYQNFWVVRGFGGVYDVIKQDGFVVASNFANDGEAMAYIDGVAA